MYTNKFDVLKNKINKIPLITARSTKPLINAPVTSSSRHIFNPIGIEANFVLSPIEFFSLALNSGFTSTIEASTSNID